jgi:hypothetical protein
VPHRISVDPTNGATQTVRGTEDERMACARAHRLGATAQAQGLQFDRARCPTR